MDTNTQFMVDSVKAKAILENAKVLRNDLSEVNRQMEVLYMNILCKSNDIIKNDYDCTEQELNELNDMCVELLDKEKYSKAIAADIE